MTSQSTAVASPVLERRSLSRRFLLVANGSARQTTARLMSALVDRLSGQGHVTNLCFRPLPPGIVPKVRLVLSSERRYVSMLRHTDVLVVHSPLALSLPTLVAARLLRRSILSFVWDLHPESNLFNGTMANPALLHFFWLLERLGLLLSSRLLISTEDYRPFLGRFGSKATVVPLWPCDPVAEVRPPPKDSDRGTLRIGFAGQINSIRGIAGGIDEVLACWTGETVVLHLFSDDPCPGALAQKAASERRLRIVEHGFLTPGRLQDQLGNLDLGWVCLEPGFRLPAFPSKILAYLCAGLPVLYTGPALPGLRQWLDTYRLGLATAAHPVIGADDVTDLRQHLSSRRTTYFAAIQDLWSNVGRLL